MNIFKMLSEGGNSLKEPAMTAMLYHYLNPNGKHGMDSAFLQSFIKPFISEYPEKFKDIKLKDHNEVINLAKTSNFSVFTLIEEELNTVSTDSKNDKRYIDLVVEIRDSENKANYVFAIENKIRAKSASDSEQLTDEIQGLLTKYHNEDSNEVHIGFVFLTENITDNIDKYTALVNHVNEKNLERNVSLLKMSWKSCEQNKSSVIDILKDILLKDSVGDFEPLHDINAYLIKSLIGFINSGFRSTREEKSEADILLNNQMEILTKEVFLSRYINKNRSYYDLFKRVIEYFQNIDWLNVRFSKTRVTVSFILNGKSKILLRISRRPASHTLIHINVSDINSEFKYLNLEKQISALNKKIPNVMSTMSFNYDRSRTYFEFNDFDKVQSSMVELMAFAKENIISSIK